MYKRQVLWSRMLENEPHTLHIVLGIAPVAQRREVAEIELVLLPLGYTGGSKGYLAGDESLAATLALMVEENTRAAIHAVGFTILLDNPEAILLGHCIRAVGMEGGVLVLRHFLYLSIKL